MTYPPVPYNAENCLAFSKNMDPPFVVPKGGEWRTVIDCSTCGGFIQNYAINLMTDKRGRCKSSSIKVYDQTGAQVGATTVPWLAAIGTVPIGAIYTVVVTNTGNHDEKCLIYESGGM